MAPAGGTGVQPLFESPMAAWQEPDRGRLACTIGWMRCSKDRDVERRSASACVATFELKNVKPLREGVVMLAQVSSLCVVTQLATDMLMIKPDRRQS